jgi:SHS2 domain-containing protein
MHEWVEHTSELELRIDAATAEDVVAGATEAMVEVLGEPDGEPFRRELRVEAGDAAGLLAAWLEELVFLAEHDALIAQTARRVELASGRLSAEVAGRRGRPSHQVKAVTYHRLALARVDGGWRATVVLDV